MENKPVEPVGRNAHRHGVETPPALIAVEHGVSARIEAEPHGVDDHFGKRGHILEPHIEPLPRDRMDDMGGVADQRDAIGDERARDRKPERKNAARADRRDLAEMQAEAALELGMEGGVGERNNTLRLPRLLGPHDRGTAALERQDRERARRQEMFFGAPVMIALVRDRGDDGRLSIIPAARRRSPRAREFPSAHRPRRPGAAPR